MRIDKGAALAVLAAFALAAAAAASCDAVDHRPPARGYVARMFGREPDALQCAPALDVVGASDCDAVVCGRPIALKRYAGACRLRFAGAVQP